MTRPALGSPGRPHPAAGGLQGAGLYCAPVSDGHCQRSVTVCRLVTPSVPVTCRRRPGGLCRCPVPFMFRYCHFQTISFSARRPVYVGVPELCSVPVIVECASCYHLLTLLWAGVVTKLCQISSAVCWPRHSGRHLRMSADVRTLRHAPVTEPCLSRPPVPAQAGRTGAVSLRGAWTGRGGTSRDGQAAGV